MASVEILLILCALNNFKLILVEWFILYYIVKILTLAFENI